MSDFELEDELRRTLDSERYLVALWRMENGQLLLRRVTHEFPLNQFQPALDLLRADLERAAEGDVKED